ncbi:hypothetical protein ES703_49409 [subsurface metagenome]
MAKQVRWSKEQLAGLKDLQAHTDQGHICILPIAKEFGEAIVWQPRIYKKGLSGVLPVSLESLEAINCPDPAGWLEQTERAVAVLSEMYPALTVGISEKVKALQAKVPAALPVGA